MASTREIRKRIRGILNIQQITRAMKLVAAAKLKKSQGKMLSSRPYITNFKKIMGNVAGRVDITDVTSPVFKASNEEKIGILAIAADKGLCGSFNTNVFRRVRTFAEENPGKKITLILVGKRLKEYFKKSDLEILKIYSDVFAKLDFSVAEGISDFAVQKFGEGEYDVLYILYNEFKSVIQQKIILEKFLPLSFEGLKENGNSSEYLYEPVKAELLNSMAERYVKVRIFSALLESMTSEFAARMMAMENATNSAGDMLDALTLQFNRARQAGITRELLEIQSGVAALA